MQGLTLSSYWKRVAVVRRNIYTIDVDHNTSKSTVERYNVGSWSWESILISDKGSREDSCDVPAGNCIYLLGGRPVPQGNVYVTKAERFNTVENEWEQIADMQEARGCAFGVASEGKIFVAGGSNVSFNTERRLQTCEVYSTHLHKRMAVHWELECSTLFGKHGLC